ncbi:MAG: T9SS type A sorting domain-containing protein [Chlorobi bacterium]|nr:T9SS type A sorting domain-containing protein [Chlorobiota bacterium]
MRLFKSLLKSFSFFTVLLLCSNTYAQTNNIHSCLERSRSTLSEPMLDSTYIISNFIIKYSLLASDAVNGIPATDDDADGVPDFVNFVANSLVDVYAKLIDTMQFTDYVKYNRPPYRTESGNYYYIYIKRLSNTELGLAQPYHFYGDNPWSEQVEKNSSSTLVYLNNKLDSLSGNGFTLENKIKVVVAHEFFHEIQIGYDLYAHHWLMEASATWAETYVYPDIQANKPLVSSFLKYSHYPLNINASDTLDKNYKQHWYSDWIFFQYISEHTDNKVIKSIFDYTVEKHQYQRDSSDVSIESIVDAIDDYGSDVTFDGEFKRFGTANVVKDYAPYNYNDPSIIPAFKDEWFTSYFTYSSARHSDIYRLGTNYHRIAIPKIGNNPIKIAFSEPTDDSITALVYTFSGLTKNITPLLKDSTLTIYVPSALDDIMVIVNNSSRADVKSVLGGMERKSYKLDVEMDASLILIKDYRNSNVSLINNFSYNSEALAWVEENSWDGVLSTVYFTNRFNVFGSNGDVFNNNLVAELSSLSSYEDQLIYAYDKYTKYNADDSLFIMATSKRFDFNVTVLKKRLSLPADSGTVLQLAIGDKKTYYDIQNSAFPFDTYDVWKYDLSTKQRTKITNAGQGPDATSNKTFVLNSNYLVWDRFIPKWQNNDTMETREIWMYDDDNAILKKIFSIHDQITRIDWLSSSDQYVAWSYMVESDDDFQRELVIYDLALNGFYYIDNYNGALKITTNGDKVAFYDSTETKLIIWKKDGIKTIDGMEGEDFFLGNSSIGWYKQINDGYGEKMAFHTRDLTTDIEKSYTTEAYPMPEIIVLGYLDGVFYYEKTDGNFPEGIYKLNLNSLGTSIAEDSIGGTINNLTLRQNYPNPFNSVTTISYNLPLSSNVTLEVYDITGRIVASLPSKRQSAGDHEFRFDASNLASGVYTYKLVAYNDKGAFVRSSKMLVQR